MYAEMDKNAETVSRCLTDLEFLGQYHKAEEKAFIDRQKDFSDLYPAEEVLEATHDQKVWQVKLRRRGISAELVEPLNFVHGKQDLKLIREYFDACGIAWPAYSTLFPRNFLLFFH